MKQLRLRVLTFFIIVLTIFSVLYVALFGFILKEQNLNRKKSESQSQTLMLVSQISTELLDSNDLNQIENQLNRASQYVDQDIILLDSQGESLNSSLKPLDDDSLNKAPVVRKAIETGEIAFQQSKEGELSVFISAMPLYDSTNQVVAVLSLIDTLKPLDSMMNIMIIFAVVFTLISIILSLLFTYYWTKKIAKAVNEIKEVTNRLSQRDYQARYEVDSYDEIDELGHAVNNLAVNLDEQMRAIQKNDRRMTKLINHLVIGVILIDELGKIQIVNPVVNELFDSNIYANVGKDYSQLIKSAELVELIEKTMRKKKPQNNEITLYLQNERIVDVNVVPIPGRNKGSLNYIVLLYEITEIRRLEKVRTDFVANASHELRTPITALKGFSETLLDGAMYDEEVLKEFLEIMLKESSRLDVMVQDILQLSRLEQKPGLAGEENVNINEVAQEVLQVLQQKSEIKQINCQIIVEDDLSVHVNRDELKQILMNLISNAITYTQNGGFVEIYITKEGQEANIKVKDNGIGIPKSQQPRIFERFYRVDKARSRNAGGTGLGLSIVKWLVENMDGSVSLESEKEQGSIFTVHLPLNN